MRVQDGYPAIFSRARCRAATLPRNFSRPLTPSSCPRSRLCRLVLAPSSTAPWEHECGKEADALFRDTEKFRCSNSILSVSRYVRVFRERTDEYCRPAPAGWTHFPRWLAMYSRKCICARVSLLIIPLYMFARVAFKPFYLAASEHL